MSQVALTDEERNRALQRFGYREREAAFLCLAALHGGYFLRRQYGQFVGRQEGGTISQLVEKLIKLEHAQVATFKASTHVYHLSARPFYAALGQEDNRNRRARQPITIKCKLMGLDFVLAHPAHRYLATEQEKVQYFHDTFGIAREALPTKKYSSRGVVTERYFVEKFPIFATSSEEPAMPPRLSFCFVDPGLAGVSAFETFLSQYRRLFTFLRQFEVVYVTANVATSTRSNRLFERLFTPGSRLGLDSNMPRLVAYFEMRRLYETRQWASFDRAKLIQLRDDREAFSGPEIDSLYALWQRGGEAALLQNGAVKQPSNAHAPGRFSTYVVPESYDFFGDLTTF